jgi:hypothetical protein
VTHIRPRHPQPPNVAHFLTLRKKAFNLFRGTRVSRARKSHFYEGELFAARDGATDQVTFSRMTIRIHIRVHCHNTLRIIRRQVTIRVSLGFHTGERILVLARSPDLLFYVLVFFPGNFVHLCDLFSEAAHVVPE